MLNLSEIMNMVSVEYGGEKCNQREPWQHGAEGQSAEDNVIM